MKIIHRYILCKLKELILEKQEKEYFIFMCNELNNTFIPRFVYYFTLIELYKDRIYHGLYGQSMDNPWYDGRDHQSRLDNIERTWKRLKL